MRAQSVPPTPANLQHAAELLRRGDVVGMPTETVYGLAGIAFSESALARIFEVKERPSFDPLIVHVAGARLREALEPQGDPVKWLAEQRLIGLERLTPVARARASKLMKKFWPGPLTLVLPKNKLLPDLATSGLDTVGLRMPRHPVAQALIEAAGSPLAAPSANRFGRISPTLPEHVLSELGDRIELVLDGGPCEVGVESTVVSVAPDGLVTLLRPGGIPRLELERVIGTMVDVAKKPYAQTHAAGSVASPGMLESHYAPRKPLYLLPATVTQLTVEQIEALKDVLPPGAPLGLLAFVGRGEIVGRRFSELLGHSVTALSLSEAGSLEEAARNLFAKLRELDASQAAVLFAEPCPVGTGLGHAISDRLRRAAQK